MSDKTYKQRTKILGIPVVGYEDRIWPEVELRKWQIVENMLLAGTQGVKNCLFTEGDMTLESQSDGNYSVILRAISASTAATGIVAGSYFMAPPVMKWEGLTLGKLYYLYLVGSPKTLAEHSMVRAVVSEFVQKERQVVLMGIVDLRGTPTLERYPDGKIYASDLGKHISDEENPHGETLLQNELVVKKNLVLEDGATIQIKHGLNKLTMPAVLLVPMVLDFASKGNEGTILTVEAPVAFVQISRMSGVSGNLGEVTIGYFGKDEKVTTNNSFCVYNSGDSGLLLRSLIYFG